MHPLRAMKTAHEPRRGNIPVDVAKLFQSIGITRDYSSLDLAAVPRDTTWNGKFMLVKPGGAAASVASAPPVELAAPFAPHPELADAG